MNSSLGFLDEEFTLSGIDCNDIPSRDAIDSKIGTLECDGISFYYDYGRYSNQGPTTAVEDFRKSFDNYHHIKFFESKMIDPKVNKIFLDSVEVVEVRAKEETDPLQFACEPCNTTAVLVFKKDTTYYPLTMNENQLSNKGFFAMIEKDDQYFKKIYQRDGEKPGLYIAPRENRYMNKNCLSLTVKDSALPNDEIIEILKGVRLKSTAKN